MTGLDEKTDTILEVAVVITDTDLKPLHEYSRVVYQPQSVLDGMNDWCKENHGRSGLTAAVPGGTPLDQVEKELLAVANQFYRPGDKIVLVGNSVGNDRRFIDQYLKEFSKRLHYRLIDVSSFKEVYRDIYNIKFDKKNAHRAVDDIHESIKELQHYLSFVQAPKSLSTK